MSHSAGCIQGRNYRPGKVSRIKGIQIYIQLIKKLCKASAWSVAFNRFNAVFYKDAVFIFHWHDVGKSGKSNQLQVLLLLHWLSISQFEKVP